MSSFCALNTGSDIHLLDHIAPLASQLQIPLIVTEEPNLALAEKYYPEVGVRYWPDLEFRLQELCDEFDTLFECKYWSLHLKQLLVTCFQKEMHLVFCPHGQSDKGYQTPLLAPYALQDTVLLYGDLLKEMLQELKIWDSIPSHIVIGNIRLAYFQLHQQRLRALCEAEIFSQLSPAKKTLLYAPTWQDADRSTTFFDCCNNLSQELPLEWNLIIKIHPLLEQRNPALFYRLVALSEKKENWILVHEFPLVYPILERADAYLGDYSSVGYDWLFFQKPMFFLEHPTLAKGRLHRCGQTLTLSKNFFQAIDQGLEKAPLFRPLQAALYEKTFSPVNGIEAIQRSMVAKQIR